MVSVSTISRELRGGLKATGTKEAAAQVGSLLAQKALSAQVTRVVFDRNRFRYHGRVKVLADAAREGGLEF